MGEFGATVTINCPTIPNISIKYFYFQKRIPNKRPIFINGFYTGHPDLTPKVGTSLDREKNTTVHMFNTTMDDRGDYECLLEYFDEQKKNTNVYINITGKNDTLFKPFGFLSGVKCKEEVTWCQIMN